MAWCLEHQNTYTKIHAGDLVWATFRFTSFLDNKALAHPTSPVALAKQIPSRHRGTKKSPPISKPLPSIHGLL